jgi:hypothetical protein
MVAEEVSKMPPIKVVAVLVVIQVPEDAVAQIVALGSPEQLQVERLVEEKVLEEVALVF